MSKDQIEKGWVQTLKSMPEMRTPLKVFQYIVLALTALLVLEAVALFITMFPVTYYLGTEPENTVFFMQKSILMTGWLFAVVSLTGIVALEGLCYIRTGKTMLLVAWFEKELWNDEQGQQYQVRQFYKVVVTGLITAAYIAVIITIPAAEFRSLFGNELWKYALGVTIYSAIIAMVLLVLRKESIWWKKAFSKHFPSEQS
ncbi:MAG: hypothetical protein OXR68_03630 [Alphaproteobacteria bacterium]|nr:hypothetical protein [Alphaproteobacteria bacterium]